MTDMPQEFAMVFLQKIMTNNKLIAAVKAQDRNTALSLVVESAMTDLQMMQKIPNMDQTGLVRAMDDAAQAEFQKNLDALLRD